MRNYEFSEAFAKQKDVNDKIARYRDEFLFPQHDGQNVVYLTGNSLGLQPKETKEALITELDEWEKYGVEAHFEAKVPWMHYHEILTDKTAQLMGALPTEVVVTHSLTTNLHLLMVSFYRPTKERFKIICEKKAFPSDQYALESQVKFHGFTTEEAIVEVGPRDGEHTIRHEDVIKAIENNKDSLALVMIGGVNYYTGQVFDMKAITEAGHKAGAVVGFDLAHAAGNLKLELHEWQVDFAAWCSYKYLNSSPGGVAGMFVHKNHEFKPELPRFAGWWGYDKETRFLMEPGFVPMKGAEGWQLSNAPVLGMAVHNVSLTMFHEVGMDALVEKREDLSAYLMYIIDEVNKKVTNCDLEIITPREDSQRGAQVSVLAHGQGKSLFDKLTENGVIADWREPNVIRMAPVPMYNNFEDVYRFGNILLNALNELK